MGVAAVSFNLTASGHRGLREGVSELRSEGQARRPVLLEDRRRISGIRG